MPSSRRHRTGTNRSGSLPAVLFLGLQLVFNATAAEGSRFGDLGALWRRDASPPSPPPRSATASTVTSTASAEPRIASRSASSSAANIGRSALAGNRGVVTPDSLSVFIPPRSASLARNAPVSPPAGRASLRSGPVRPLESDHASRPSFPAIPDDMTRYLRRAPSQSRPINYGNGRTAGWKMIWEPDGHRRGHTRVRYEDPGDKRSPDDLFYTRRHDEAHYHVELKPSHLTWPQARKAGLLRKLKPGDWVPGNGTGFLPGERLPVDLGPAGKMRRAFLGSTMSSTKVPSAAVRSTVLSSPFERGGLPE